jgi:hypothetical protein
MIIPAMMARTMQRFAVDPVRKQAVIMPVRHIRGGGNKPLRAVFEDSKSIEVKARIPALVVNGLHFSAVRMGFDSNIYGEIFFVASIAMLRFLFSKKQLGMRGTPQY